MLWCACSSARNSGGIKGTCGHLPPPSRRLCPHLPSVRRKIWPKSAIVGKFLDFCPLTRAFCPLDALTKNSGAATGKKAYIGWMAVCSFKATACLKINGPTNRVWPCLVQLLTWLHVSDYRNFWKTERSNLNINSFTWNNCFSYRNFRLPMSALATVYSKCTAKIDFLIGYFMLPYCWCWHWKSKVSSYIIW